MTLLKKPIFHFLQWYLKLNNTKIMKMCLFFFQSYICFKTWLYSVFEPIYHDKQLCFVITRGGNQAGWLRSAWALSILYTWEKGWGLSWFWLPYSRLIWMWYAQKCGQAQDIAIRTKISNMPAYLVEVSNVHLHSMENMHEFCNRNDSVGNCSYLKGACRCALNVDSLIFHKPHEIFYLCCSPQNSQQWLGGVCAMLWRLHS